MSSTLYNAVRLCAVLITLIAVLCARYIPERELMLHPNGGMVHSIYADSDWGGTSTAEWVNQENVEWLCEYRESETHGGCGYSISFGLPAGEGLDFSAYRGFKLNLTYEGDASRIRVFIRNFNPAYSKKADQNSSKFMSLMLRTQDLHGDVFIDFNELTVIDWWLTQFDLPRRLAGTEFDNVVTIGIDYVTPGTHKLRINKIEMVGEWLEREDLFFAIIILWMCLLAWEGIGRFYTLNKKSQAETQRLTELASSYHKLEIEKHEYEVKSTTDTLTGILNRGGMEQFIFELLEKNRTRDNIGLLVIDVDHFKRINDRRGHDAGDRILQGLTAVVSLNTRDKDVFGRWGGEEFLLVCTDINAEYLRLLADKLRGAVAAYRFEAHNPLSVSISIGATMFSSSDTFTTAFKRADDALYRAKDSGRNCVIYLPTPNSTD